jgi:two-component system response regulator FixJ
MTVRKAIDKVNGNSRGRTQMAPASGSTFEFAGKELLTPREREVLALVATGASNKEAGRLLGISPRTVETHRAHIMQKVGARNAADLVRIVFSGGRSPLSAVMVA